MVGTGPDNLQNPGSVSNLPGTLEDALTIAPKQSTLKLSRAGVDTAAEEVNFQAEAAYYPKATVELRPVRARISA